MTKIVIMGDTAFSAMIYDLIHVEGDVQVIAFCTKKNLLKYNSLNDVPCVPFEELDSLFDMADVMILNSIGYSKMNTIRSKVNGEIRSKGYRLFKWISRQSNVYSNDIGDGSIIMPGAFVGPGVRIGESCIVYSGCSLTHHIVIEDNCFIASGVVVGGNVRIGRNSFIGLNSTIRNRVDIAGFSLVGCASNVVRNIEDEGSVVIGNPAKVMEGKNSHDCL